MKTLKRQWQEYRECPRWRANLVVAALSTIAAAFLIRWWFWIIALLIPSDSWAADTVHAVARMGAMQFWLTAAIAGVGGAVSFLHDVRVDASNLRALTALGHMLAAQFAGLLTFLLAIEWQMPEYLALALCGVAGWGGNHYIEKLSAALFSRAGIDARSRNDR